MEEFMKGRTTFMIAHRFWTVASADTIVVMDEGRIVDAGPHKALLERCELYAHLHSTQFLETP
jgi:ABC-type multidrug transport system fused ATPase/permease subunit